MELIKTTATIKGEHKTARHSENDKGHACAVRLGWNSSDSDFESDPRALKG